nr:metallophosphoesterase [Candidatus Kapabacteria bacterium]
MKQYNSIITILLLCLLVSCSNTNNTSEQTIDPFSNGGSERNMIVVISDIHLGADLSYAECNTNRAVLVKLLEKVRVAPNVKELVIAGDMIDEWFVPANINTYQGKNQNDFVKRIASTNKIIIDVLNNIIQEKKVLVTYVPGNHDLTITAENIESILPGINQARDEMQGLGTYSPISMPELAIEHGHRYNFFCAPDPISNKDIAPGSIMPPGYFFTRIATLHVVQKELNNGVDPVPGDTMPIVTKNIAGDESQQLAYSYWNTWKGLMLSLPISNKFTDKVIVTNVGGFTEAYSINDLMPFQETPGGFIDCKVFKGIQDSWVERCALNKVTVNIPTAEAITNAADYKETDVQANREYFMNTSSNKRIVIFGHTHYAEIIPMVNYKNEKSIYANSGTWIDKNPSTANFVVITPQSSATSSQTHVKLYNFMNGVVSKMA